MFSTSSVESKALDGFIVEPAVEQVIDTQVDNEIPVLMESEGDDQIPSADEEAIKSVSSEEIPDVEPATDTPSDDEIPVE